MKVTVVIEVEDVEIEVDVAILGPGEDSWYETEMRCGGDLTDLLQHFSSNKVPYAAYDKLMTAIEMKLFEEQYIRRA